ncbi:MAG: NADH-quinone oxidoreductase subunit NuoN [Rickettsiales bacterium]|jgi:NADH-quinone oxidoreductase subunit N|nr:NADH-quinone oxidoreductase subunit NuoN [Rickettsiales bacterium]
MTGDITMAALPVILPELYLCLVAMALLVYGVYRKPAAYNMMWLGVAAILGAGYLVICQHHGAQTIFNGMFHVDGFTLFAKLLILGSAALVLIMASDWLHVRGRPFEFVILKLFAVLGMLLMVSANDLLALYMALEMSSLALYVLASFSRDTTKSSEAGLKYFMLGALASGMMLFGMSLVYGFAGTTSFDALGVAFAGGEVSKGIIVGMILIIVGFCFKLSAVPFHMWTPDVYEGAPTPVTAFFATAPKIAAMVLFTRLLLDPFASLFAQWQQVVIAASVLSMLVGALAAIVQTNIKRLLAYSSIGHVGFMLMALATGSQAGVQAMLIYLGVYIFMSAGMFGCVMLMRRGGHAVEEIKDLSGLSQTHPAMAIAISIFMFSMAGIPPLAGFFGKMFVIIAAVSSGLVWLAVIGVLTSVIGCYYYIKVVKVMYFDEPAWGFDKSQTIWLPASVSLGAAVTFLFFLLPMPLIAQASIAAKILVP